jgi:hypothetical protein
VRSGNILNEQRLLEQEADLAKPELAWWHEQPTIEEEMDAWILEQAAEREHARALNEDGPWPWEMGL